MITKIGRLKIGKRCPSIPPDCREDKHRDSPDFASQQRARGRTAQTNNWDTLDNTKHLSQRGVMAITEIQETIVPNYNHLMAHLPPAYFCPPPRPRIKDFLCNILFGDPKVLGMIHIMTSLATAALGIIATLKFKSMWDCTANMSPSTYTVTSGIAIWGPVIHVGTGIISIMTYRGINGDLVTGAVYMNIFSCLIAATAVVLLTVELMWTIEVPCNENQLDEVHGIQGALFFFYIVEFSVSVLCAMVIKQRAQSTSDPPLDPPLYVNEPVAGPYLPISLPTQGIYTTIMPAAPPPEYTP
ncbi:uncharacterized protein LOC118215263 isoform X2 [Anguilla anguilla]|uniref:uncharacterized protein LOC118215263 isoform X2 n=1 Tax=Anguilla anguilla TaxID=7936 RepID=UPI0015B0B42B|nr:uncharacterized protein LOC118215263 isoform X2 [Anguilla anguilla]